VKENVRAVEGAHTRTGWPIRKNEEELLK
jgi:hypothetical protein